MAEAEVDRFLADQRHKCDQLFEGMSVFGDMMSVTTGISLFGDNVTNEDRLEKYRGVAKTSVDDGNGTEIRQCPPTFDGLLCWPRTDAPGTATLPCPPASIMGYTDLASDNLRALAVASKVCLANGEWYQNSDGVAWSNYSLCVLNSTRYIIDKNLNYTRWYETPAEFALLNKWLPIIRMVSHIGYVTSFTTLIVAMVVFSLLRKLRNPRNRLHMHLFASFIMRAFMALLKDWSFIDGIGLAWDVVFVDGQSAFIRERNTWVCKVITSLWQYFIVANYSWILMEGMYLHNLVFFALCTDTSTIALYIVLGWGLPALVVVPWIIIRATIEDTLCWTTNEDSSLFLIIRIPIITSILEMGKVDSGFSTTLRNTLYLFLGIILSQRGRTRLAILRSAVRVLPGRLRGFSLLSAERRSQGGNATSVEGPTIKEGGRFLHLRAHKKFEGRNQSKTASIGGR
ncbi:parathyroid hormone 2 receptor-like isoform X2 [Temnothorax curvispinosus]|uniref:Parathyroid hormone 2 receptor-like isoform X2 n=1 Tax=Temnothorax curvispinosus TaxID=300111 RepID=A0A6J1PUS4_9HYME|nr:parathyroid hormone 2 receptor-like isoform X2 [Temnothorax curvispinosus]